MSKFSTFRELIQFIRVSRNWWLVPILVVLLGVGTLLVLVQGSALSPVIYTMF